jgi:hypothetical protein
MNEPQFKIFGQERRQLKKELSLLRSHVKNFWRCHQIDLDMADIYGRTPGYPLGDEAAKDAYDKAVSEIERLSVELSIPYK